MRPTADGIDPSGLRYSITHCLFDTGDDCIAVKPQRARKDGHVSCEDFLIEDCEFKAGHGLSIGGQTPGGLKRMTVRNCTFNGTDAGIRMKANRGSGGLVEDLLYENLTMKNVKVAVQITSYYPKVPTDLPGDPAAAVNATTPIWRNITIRNVTAVDSGEAGQLFGLAEMPIDSVTFENVNIAAKKRCGSCVRTGSNSSTRLSRRQKGRQSRRTTRGSKASTPRRCSESRPTPACHPEERSDEGPRLKIASSEAVRVGGRSSLRSSGRPRSSTVDDK